MRRSWRATSMTASCRCWTGWGSPTASCQTPDGAGPILLAERIENSGPTVITYGHGDTVRGLEDQWRAGLDPWTLQRDGDRWYGRGSADNKGQHAINLSALEAVLAARGGTAGLQPQADPGNRRGIRVQGPQPGRGRAPGPPGCRRAAGQRRAAQHRRGAHPVHRHPRQRAFRPAAGPAARRRAFRQLGRHDDRPRHRAQPRHRQHRRPPRAHPGAGLGAGRGERTPSAACWTAALWRAIPAPPPSTRSGANPG